MQPYKRRAQGRHTKPENYICIQKLAQIILNHSPVVLLLQLKLSTLVQNIHVWVFSNLVTATKPTEQSYLASSHRVWQRGPHALGTLSTPGWGSTKEITFQQQSPENDFDSFWSWTLSSSKNRGTNKKLKLGSTAQPWQNCHEFRSSWKPELCSDKNSLKTEKLTRHQG